MQFLRVCVQFHLSVVKVDHSQVFRQCAKCALDHLLMHQLKAQVSTTIGDTIVHRITFGDSLNIPQHCLSIMNLGALNNAILGDLNFPLVIHRMCRRCRFLPPFGIFAPFFYFVEYCQAMNFYPHSWHETHILINI